MKLMICLSMSLMVFNTGCGRPDAAVSVLSESGGEIGAEAVTDSKSVATAPRRVTRLIAKEISLGTLRPGFVPGSVKTSPDAMRYAYVVRGDSSDWVILDGKATEYPWIFHKTLTFSSDSKRFAYNASKSRTEPPAFAVVDGKEGPMFDQLRPSTDGNTIFFSPDAKHVAYVGEKNERSTIVVDGRSGRVHNGGAGRAGIIWSPDSRRWGFILLNFETGKWSVVVDDHQEGPHDEILAPVEVNSSESLITDHYQSRAIVFSSDSRKYAYIARDDTKGILFVDGKAQAEGEAIAKWADNADTGERTATWHGGPRMPLFSPTGNRFAYVDGRTDQELWYVIDGKPQQKFQVTSPNPLFSRDGKHFAYFAGSSEQSMAVINDGKAGPIYGFPSDAGPGQSDLLFSPDGKRLAARLHRNGKFFYSINGMEGTPYDDVLLPRFSPDSSRFCYVGFYGKQAENGITMVLDGAEGWRYEDILGDSEPNFSPDSQHVTYGAFRDGAWRVVVDGAESTETFSEFLAAPRFINATTVRTIAVRDGEIFRIEYTLELDKAISRAGDSKPLPGVPPKPAIEEPAPTVEKVRIIETASPGIQIEVYSDRTAFQTRLGNRRSLDFEDIDANSSNVVPFEADRYAEQGILISGTEGQFVGRSFGYPSEYVPSSGRNMYAPGPRAAPDADKNEGGHESEITFVEVGQPAVVAGFGAMFIDADYPDLGSCKLAVFGKDQKLLAEDGPITGKSGQGIFRGMIAVNRSGLPIPIIRRVTLINGSGWPEVSAAEGVTLDDFLFGIPVQLEGETKSTIPSPSPVHIAPPDEIRETQHPGDEFLPPHLRRTSLVNGKPHGEMRGLAPDGRVIFTQDFADGDPHGLRNCYYPNGKKFSVTPFLHGMKEGTSQGWFPDGTLGNEMNWKNNQQHGSSTFYYRNGKKALEMTYVHGELNGLLRAYEPTGELNYEGEKIDGKIVREKVHIPVAKEVMDRRQLENSPGSFRTIWEAETWIPLFDGIDLTGWNVSPNLGQSTRWEVRDGVLVGRGTGISYLHTTKGDFGDFHLRAEVRINEKGNSGVYVRVPSAGEFNNRVPKGPEIQIIGDKQTANKTGSIFQRSGNSNRGNATPGEWFTLDIIAKEGILTVKVEDVETAKTSLSRDAATGHLGLQLWGTTTETIVEFRKIEVKKFATALPVARPMPLRNVK